MQDLRSKKKPIKSYKDLKIYRFSYKLAIEIFHLSKKFPKEEIYSLTAQIRNSSRYEEVSKMLNGLLEKWQTF